jgi:hypothetical protein
MPEKVTYYAMYLGGHTDGEPTGIARRREADDAQVDEGLRPDMAWSQTPLIAGWQRGDTTVELVEISEADVAELVKQLRRRWGVA